MGPVEEVRRRDADVAGADASVEAADALRKIRPRCCTVSPLAVPVVATRLPPAQFRLQRLHERRTDGGPGVVDLDDGVVVDVVGYVIDVIDVIDVIEDVVVWQLFFSHHHLNLVGCKWR